MDSFSFDASRSCITLDDGTSIPLSDPRAFSIISGCWLRAGWDTKYVYGFSWMGRPIIQLPEDLVRIQEVIWDLKPDLVIETGVAHGGSLVFYAGLLAAYGEGTVLGIDIEIRKRNRLEIEGHELAKRIKLIEGNSISADTVEKVRGYASLADRVLVILDSNHSRDHVYSELKAYSTFVTPGSYIVACDGIMQTVVGAPRTEPDWLWNNPITAIDDFLAENSDFTNVEPPRPFNEGADSERITYWPRGFLQKIQ